MTQDQSNISQVFLEIDIEIVSYKGYALKNPDNRTHIPSPMVGLVSEIDYCNKMTEFVAQLERVDRNVTRRRLMATCCTRPFLYVLACTIFFAVDAAGFDLAFGFPLGFVAVLFIFVVQTVCIRKLIDREERILSKDTTEIFRSWLPRVRAELKHFYIPDEDEKLLLLAFHVLFGKCQTSEDPLLPIVYAVEA